MLKIGDRVELQTIDVPVERKFEDPTPWPRIWVKGTIIDISPQNPLIVKVQTDGKKGWAWMYSKNLKLISDW